MSRRKCTFNDNLKSQYPFLIKRPKHGDSDVTCTICNASFSIANSGKNQIDRHVKTGGHADAAKDTTNNAKVDNFYPKVLPNNSDLELARKEGAYAYHIVQHDQSFRSMDCTSKLIKSMFDPKFSTARTKCEAIVTSIIAPHALQEVIEDLKNSVCLSVSTDCSNHFDIKLFPVMVRYFQPLSGVQVKLLDLHQLQNETADSLLNSLEKTISKHDLQSKVICLCADNTNTNFGGVNRKGENNFFTKLRTKLPNKIIGVGCSAHILNNAFEHALNCLPIDIEALIYKIYKHFSIYTVRTETLREYCDFVNVEFRKVLSSCKTRWLSLSPAVERTIAIYEGLRSYFLSESSTPRLIANFFEKEENEIWLWFAHLQAETFQRSVLEVEKDHPSAVEVLRSLQNLERVLLTRKDARFVGIKAKQLLSQYAESGYDLQSFYMVVDNFYTTALEYIKKWKSPLEEVGAFSWILLTEPLSWDRMEKSLEFSQAHFPLIQIDEGSLFDEMSYVNNYVTTEELSKWNGTGSATNIKPDERWTLVINALQKAHLKIENIEKLLQIGFSLPGSSAPVERVFSRANNYWTPEKTQLQVETLRAVLSIKTNISKSCTEYYEYLEKKPEILRAIHSSQKYK